MRTDLDHLPAAKQREFERIVRLFEEIRRSTHPCDAGVKEEGTHPQDHPLRILCARRVGRRTAYCKGYQSDFDLLITVNDERLTDRVPYWAKAEERLNRELAITRTLRTPVNFIVHSLHEVNDGLAHGRFFFI
jgi:hypothetical protein